MPPVLVWFNLVVGNVTMTAALLEWLRGRRQRSSASHWFSVMFIASSLCAWFSAVGVLVGPPAARLWYVLVVAASLLMMCSAIIGALNWSREQRLN
jgi:SNF family Na+-dependent transporter